MRRTKEYRGIWLKPEAIRETYAFFESSFLTENHKRYEVTGLTIEAWGRVREFKTDEAFFAAYRPGLANATYKKVYLDYELLFRVVGKTTYVGVKAHTLTQIESVFQALEGLLPEYVYPESEFMGGPRPTVWLGHGAGVQWEILGDYLMDRHGFIVKAFEIGPERAGGVSEVLSDERSSKVVALLMIEEEDLSGNAGERFLRRVCYEAGLLQGTLGRDRVFFVTEQTDRDLLPIEGIRQFRYRAGHAREIFWDLLIHLQTVSGDPMERGAS
jgi:hypothetical protein